MAMFGQQLGGVMSDEPAPPFASAAAGGRVRPLADTAGLGEGRGRFAKRAARTDADAFAPDPERFPHVLSSAPELIGAPRPAGALRPAGVLVATPGSTKGGLGLQFAELRVVGAPDESRASVRLAQDMGSRRPAAAIEAMLRQLLADHHVLAARKLADALPPDQPLGESLRRLLVVLAPPAVRRRLPARAKGFDNLEWLRRNAGRHAGRWVALVDGELLAADDSLAALRRKLAKIAPHANPFLHRL